MHVRLHVRCAVCGVVWCGAVWCGVLRCALLCRVLCRVLCDVPCCAVTCLAVLCNHQFVQGGGGGHACARVRV